MNILIILLIALILITLVGFYLYKQDMKKLRSEISAQSGIIESMEKYVEIFNVNNVKNYLNQNEFVKSNELKNKIKNIKKELERKIIKPDEKYTAEKEVLFDFVTLTLSLLIRVPQSMRVSIIENYTENEIIKKILYSKLEKIKNYYIPISLLEIAVEDSFD